MSVKNMFRWLFVFVHYHNSLEAALIFYNIDTSSLFNYLFFFIYIILLSIRTDILHLCITFFKAAFANQWSTGTFWWSVSKCRLSVKKLHGSYIVV